MLSKKTLELAIQAIRNDRHDRGWNITIITKLDGQVTNMRDKNKYYWECEEAIKELEKQLDDYYG